MSEWPKPGRVKEITAISNPLVKSIRGLSQKKNREREGVFLAEGMKLATDALAAGWTVRTLIHTRAVVDNPGLANRIDDLAAQTRGCGGDVLIVSDKIMSAITRRDNAQAVVSVIEPQIHDLAEMQPSGNAVWLALDRVRDPGNLGTIIRTADALGAAGVVLVGETTDPFALEAVRATMGSLFHVPLYRSDEATFVRQCQTWKVAAGANVIGTHLKGAVDHRSIDYSTGPQILLMGNEQQGLTDGLADACDNLVLIAMAGEADSLNLAVASGIMLFEARRHAL